MRWKKLNSVVSYYEKPVLGTISGKNPIMALAIDKTNKPLRGIARVITKRSGNVDIPGFVDQSKLIIVESKDGLNWKKIKDLKIKNIEKVIKKITKSDRYFIGLEDPDIIRDEKNLIHIYFSISFKLKNRVGYKVYLGHAQGTSLDSLKATKPVLNPNEKEIDGFKESCFSPVKSKNNKLVLNEIMVFPGLDKGMGFSAVSLSLVKKPGKPWKCIKIVLNPKKMKYSWIKGHASPCRIFSPDLIVHKDLLVGIINGREPTKIVKGKKIYKKFRPGLFLFNPKTGEIPWISPKPLIEDPKATTITFASEVVPLNKQEIIIYAHPNDSFVRAYKINLGELKKLLPKNI
jgi:hypothetical protein